MEKRRSFVVPVLAVLLLAAYVGSYLLLVNLPSLDHVEREVDGSQVISAEVVDRYYSHGGQLAEVVFWPLEQIDRRIRRRAWAFQ